MEAHSVGSSWDVLSTDSREDSDDLGRTALDPDPGCVDPIQELSAQDGAANTGSGGTTEVPHTGECHNTKVKDWSCMPTFDFSSMPAATSNNNGPQGQDTVKRNEEGAPTVEGDSSDIDGITQHRWDYTQRKVADIRAVLNGYSRAEETGTPQDFNILVVGAPGVGKTTICGNLASALSCGTYPPRESQAPGSSSGDKPIRAHTWDAMKKSRKREEFRTTVVVPDESGNDSGRFTITIQDTPGLSHAYLQWDVVALISGSMGKHYCRQQNIEPMDHYPDSHIHVCLYMIGPHAFGPEDVDSISQLSTVVVVIPLLAKADTMTKVQLEDMRAKVQAALMAREKSEGREIMYRPSVDYMQDAGAERIDPPYAVMGSTVMDPAVGVVWPIRRYPGGVAEAFSSQDYDLLGLKKLLFFDGPVKIKQLTAYKYSVYSKLALAGSKWAQPHCWEEYHDGTRSTLPRRDCHGMGDQTLMDQSTIEGSPYDVRPLEPSKGDQGPEVPVEVKLGKTLAGLRGHFRAPVQMSPSSRAASARRHANVDASGPQEEATGQLPSTNTASSRRGHGDGEALVTQGEASGQLPPTSTAAFASPTANFHIRAAHQEALAVLSRNRSSPWIWGPATMTAKRAQEERPAERLVDNTAGFEPREADGEAKPRDQGMDLWRIVEGRWAEMGEGGAGRGMPLSASERGMSDRGVSMLGTKDPRDHMGGGMAQRAAGFLTDKRSVMCGPAVATLKPKDHVDHMGLGPARLGTGFPSNDRRVNFDRNMAMIDRMDKALQLADERATASSVPARRTSTAAGGADMTLGDVAGILKTMQESMNQMDARIAALGGDASAPSKGVGARELDAKVEGIVTTLKVMQESMKRMDAWIVSLSGDASGGSKGVGAGDLDAKVKGIVATLGVMTQSIQQMDARIVSLEGDARGRSRGAGPGDLDAKVDGLAATLRALTECMKQADARIASLGRDASGASKGVRAGDLDAKVEGIVTTLGALTESMKSVDARIAALGGDASAPSKGVRAGDLDAKVGIILTQLEALIDSMRQMDARICSLGAGGAATSKGVGVADLDAKMGDILTKLGALSVSMRQMHARTVSLSAGGTAASKGVGVGDLRAKVGDIVTTLEGVTQVVSRLNAEVAAIGAKISAASKTVHFKDFEGKMEGFAATLAGMDASNEAIEAQIPRLSGGGLPRGMGKGGGLQRADKEGLTATLAAMNQSIALTDAKVSSLIGAMAGPSASRTSADGAGLDVGAGCVVRNLQGLSEVVKLLDAEASIRNGDSAPASAAADGPQGVGFIPALFGINHSPQPQGVSGVPPPLTPKQQHQAFLSRLLLMLGSFAIMCLLLF